MQDRLLLRQYVKHGSQDAFAEIVRRHLPLVYSACLRETEDRPMAEDATQGVFLILARRAPSLGRNVSLAGWLYRVAVFAARDAVRQEQRRKRRERDAAQGLDDAASTNGSAHPQRALLGKALASLNAREREAVLLRFFEDASFKEAGEALGISEDAAQKRVSRGLEKMRAHLAQSGPALTVALLGALLSAEAAHAVPVRCVDSLLQLVPDLKITLKASPLFGTRAYQISQGALRNMWITKAAVVMGLGLTGVSAGLVAVGALGSSAAPQGGHTQSGGGGIGGGQVSNDQPYRVDQILITGNRGVPTSAILGHLAAKAGDTLSVSQLMKALVIPVYNMGWFEKVGPFQCKKAADGGLIVTLPVVENSSAKGAREWYKTHKP